MTTRRSTYGGASLPAVMPDDGEGVEDLFALRAATDVVHHERRIVDDADVIEPAGEAPGHDVAAGERRARRFSAALEERHQIRHAAVVDVRVRRGESPHRR